MFFETPFIAMQAAVDIVARSPHPTNKIAATLYGLSYGISRTNYWPKSIADHFGFDTDIGNSSGTVHAETACILQAGHATEHSYLCITDPFCPNCAKNIVEAGVKKIFIDHKGFDKDFFQRRGDHFHSMSMRICEKAGVSVYELWRRDERLVPIYEAPQNTVIAEDSPIYREPIGSASETIFQTIIANAFERHHRRKFVVALVQSPAPVHGHTLFALTARGHAVSGFTMNDPDDVRAIEHPETKYSFFQEPLNRLLMYTARHGLKILDGFLFSAQVPTSRELVNLVGADIDHLTIGNPRSARDADAIRAMEQLSTAKIIQFR